MKAAVSVCAEAPALARPRAADYVELAKPRVAVLVLFTVGAGVLLASGRDFQLLMLLHTVLGTALVAAGASAFNQLFERHSDARMHRTENRPLPAGRLQPLEVAVFGTLLALGGVAYLALLLPTPWAALVAALTFVGYAFVYTPLKPVTVWNTLVGAVPGALPPVIGWTAVRGTLAPEACLLFAILFLWQVPHFLAITLFRREEYARAGLVVQPNEPGGETEARRNIVRYTVALVFVSLLFVPLGFGRTLYFATAVCAGAVFLGYGLLGLRRDAGERWARNEFALSLAYLTVLFTVLMIDRGTPAV